MSTITAPTDVIAKLESGASALTQHIPAEAGWSIEVEPFPSEIEGGRVVVASLGPDARIALLLVPPFARALIIGPPPADSLEEALQPGFAAAAKALSTTLDRPLALGTLSESTIEEAITPMGGATHSFRLNDGENHVASFVVATSFEVEPDTQADMETPVFAQIPESNAPTAHHPVSMLADVEMGVTVELGRAKMSVAEILGLTIGSVIELDRLAGSPVDVLVNGTLIARGEVVVIDEEFGVRVSEVLGYEPTDRNRR